jgi:hypothetical protein
LAANTWNHTLVGLLFFVVRCDILHDCVGLIINDDQSIKFFTELHLACTDLDEIISSSPFNLTLEHNLFFIDWLDALLTEGQINSVIHRELQPLKNRLAWCPQPQEVIGIISEYFIQIC